MSLDKGAALYDARHGRADRPTDPSRALDRGRLLAAARHGDADARRKLKELGEQPPGARAGYDDTGTTQD